MLNTVKTNSLNVNIVDLDTELCVRVHTGLYRNHTKITVKTKFHYGKDRYTCDLHLESGGKKGKVLSQEMHLRSN